MPIQETGSVTFIDGEDSDRFQGQTMTCVMCWNRLSQPTYRSRYQ